MNEWFNKMKSVWFGTGKWQMSVYLVCFRSIFAPTSDKCFMLLVTPLFAYGQITCIYSHPLFLFTSRHQFQSVHFVNVLYLFFLFSFLFFVFGFKSKFNVIQFRIYPHKMCSNVCSDVPFWMLCMKVLCFWETETQRGRERKTEQLIYVSDVKRFFGWKMIDEDLLLCGECHMHLNYRTINANQFHYDWNFMFSQAPANVSATKRIQQRCKNYYQHMHINFYELLSLGNVDACTAQATHTQTHTRHTVSEYNLHKNVPSSKCFVSLSTQTTGIYSLHTKICIYL